MDAGCSHGYVVDDGYAMGGLPRFSAQPACGAAGNNLQLASDWQPLHHGTAERAQDESSRDREHCGFRCHDIDSAYRKPGGDDGIRSASAVRH